MLLNRIYELVQIFGFQVDYDQWEVIGKEWIRITARDYAAGYNHSLVIYKGDLTKGAQPTENWEQFVCEEMQNYLFRIGQYSMKVKINDLLDTTKA